MARKASTSTSKKKGTIPSEQQTAQPDSGIAASSPSEIGASSSSSSIGKEKKHHSTPPKASFQHVLPAPQFLAQKHGFVNLGHIFHNLSRAELYEHILFLREGMISSDGAVFVETTPYTKLVVRDKFIVEESINKDNIAWSEANRAFDQAKFNALKARIAAYLQRRNLYVHDCFVGSDDRLRVPFRIVTELAWHGLFIRNMFTHATPAEMRSFEPRMTILVLPGFKASPELDGTRAETFVLYDFSQRLALLGGTCHAEEIKKAVFTVTGYALMLRRVLPMRCAAIADPRGYTALLIGANGSGKTTLSVHSSYKLLGDDAHAWSDDGIFTLENGVYAKALNITRDTHTSIYNASQTFGTILENVVCDSTSRTPLFDDTSISDNARISISNDALGLVQPTIPQLRAEHPKTVLLLIHDPLGVLPLAARLSHEQAAFLFLSGYSAKHPHTVEPKSDTKLEPKVVFTATFGEVFMLQDPVLHTQLFYERLHKHKVQVWLINTGWYGGTQFTGRRIALDTTRALVHAILAGNLDTVEFAADPIFHVHIPTACPNVPSNLFQTRHEWSDSDAYDKTAYKLLALLTENAQKYAGKIDTAILHAFTSSPPLHTPAHDTAQPASQKKSIRLSQRRTTAPQNINIEQDVLSESLQSKDTQAGVSRRNQRRKSVASDEANAGNASIAHEHTLDNTVLFGGTRASTEDIYVPPSLFAPLEGEYRPSHEQASMTYVSDTEENNDARHSDMVHDADVPAGLQGQSQYRGPRRRSPRTRRHAR